MLYYITSPSLGPKALRKELSKPNMQKKYNIYPIMFNSGLESQGKFENEGLRSIIVMLVNFVVGVKI